TGDRECTCSSIRARHSSRVSAAMIVVSFLGVEARACRAFPLDSDRWTDLVHVPCQCYTRPETHPLWWMAARPARQAPCAAGDGGADHLGRRCQHIDMC